MPPARGVSIPVLLTSEGRRDNIPWANESAIPFQSNQGVCSACLGCKDSLQVFRVSGGASHTARILTWTGGDIDSRASQMERIGARSCTTFPPSVSKLRCFVGSVGAAFFFQARRCKVNRRLQPQRRPYAHPYTNGINHLSRGPTY